ncbi:ATP-dependent zinc protease [Colwelliaceae bacterium 6471]
MTALKKMKVGALEKCDLPELKISGLEVRIDTGAQTSSLHVDNINEIMEQSQKWIEFDIHPDVHHVEVIVRCRAKVKAERRIKSSTGHEQVRYVIDTTIMLGEQSWLIEITLSDRSQMTYLMLLGREAMVGRVIVDPEFNFLLEND